MDKDKFYLSNTSDRKTVEIMYKDKMYIDVPCGKCPACIERKSNEWATRIYYEWINSKSAQFFTLTYAEEHLTHNYVTLHYPTYDEEVLLPVLCKRDVQLFMKRLRKRLGNGIRFFLGGEYGEEFGRPHYHFILFNYPSNISEDDLLQYVVDSWSYGMVQSGETNIKRVMYVAKYIYSATQLQDNTIDGFVKPFILCSRRPGLGLSYVTDKTKKYHNDTLETCVFMEDGKIMPMPRYYRDKLFTDENKQILFDRYLDEEHDSPTPDEIRLFLKRFNQKKKKKKL